MGLAAHVARRFGRRGPSDDDLRQVAFLALVKAVDRFDPDRNVAFSTFAGRTIEGEIKRHFRDHTWTRAGAAVGEGDPPAAAPGHRRADPAARPVADACRSWPSTSASSIDEVDRGHRRRLGLRHGAASTRRPATTARAPGRSATRMPASVTSPTSDMVEELMRRLPPREQEIVRLRFYEELSQSEIAERVGISQMHVSRLLRRSFEQMRGGASRSRATAAGRRQRPRREPAGPGRCGTGPADASRRGGLARTVADGVGCAATERRRRRLPPRPARGAPTEPRPAPGGAAECAHGRQLPSRSGTSPTCSGRSMPRSTRACGGRRRDRRRSTSPSALGDLGQDGSRHGPTPSVVVARGHADGRRWSAARPRLASCSRLSDSRWAAPSDRPVPALVDLMLVELLAQSVAPVASPMSGSKNHASAAPMAMANSSFFMRPRLPPPPGGRQSSPGAGRQQVGDGGARPTSGWARRRTFSELSP